MRRESPEARQAVTVSTIGYRGREMEGWGLMMGYEK